MSSEYGAVCGYFRFFAPICNEDAADCQASEICRAEALGIAPGEVNFIRKAMNGTEHHLLAVLGQDRKPIFVLTGTYPSVGALVAFMCDMELRDFCESDEILADVCVSPRFYRCLKQEGFCATSREKALLATYAVGRLLNLNGFLKANLDPAIFSNEISLKCARFAQTAASLCGCSLKVDFLFAFGIMVKGFDRGMLAAFVICAVSYGIAAVRDDVCSELRFNCGKDGSFYAELFLGATPDPVYFRVVRDAADRAGMLFLSVDGSVAVSAVRKDYSKLSVKQGFVIDESYDPWVLTGYCSESRKKE